MNEKQITLITGTRKGIGKYLVNHYTALGHKVIGCSRNETEFSTDNYQHFCLDVCDEKEVKKMFSQIRKTYGSLHVLINNAGIASMNHALLTTVDTVKNILNTNVLGPFLFCREAAKLMQRHKYGRIVNFATVATPLKLEGEAIYASSKAAVVNLTQILARELADMGITVNAIGPSPVKTDLIKSVPENKLNQILSRQAIHRLKVFEDNNQNEAIVWKDQSFSYKWLIKRYNYWKNEIESKEIKNGTITIVEADFSPNSVALLLALIAHRCVFVPITKSVASKRDEFIDIAQGEVLFIIDENDNVSISKLPYKPNHEIYKKLRKIEHPGLVLFSSGSTGKSKASVHDINGILEKFKVQRYRLRTITFLLYDHIGGFNTMLYVLSNAGLIVTVDDRNPDGVLKAVEKYKVELLPTSPTFINLILLSEAYKRYDINSLKTVTYGTEPMPESTLKRFNNLFPNIKLLQTYGLSEVGILRSKSKSSDSLWVKVGGEGFETRVVGGMLEIKAKSAMLGYLNAPSSFTNDGWFKTGDAVEVKGEYIKILGRKSEIINVGGEKVYPQEVENIILELNNVAEATVYGEKNPIVGNIVCARIRLHDDFEQNGILNQIKVHCSKKLQNYKVPIKIFFENKSQYSERYKKKR